MLIYGEGLNERVFLEYLKLLYGPKNVSIKVRNGKGGSPLNIVVDAVNEWGSFDKKIVVLDNDRAEKEILTAELLADKRGIKVVKNYPCLEATLLKILESEPHNDKSSLWFKKEFESKYMEKKRRGNLAEYSKVFSKKTINNARKKIKELDLLISIIENANE